MTELYLVRERGLRLLGLCAWVWTILAVTTLVVQGSPLLLPAAALMVLNNVVPTTLMLRAPRTPAARNAMAICYVVHPAILVFLMNGQASQMDAHLYFLVALAGLTMLYDWRALVLASILILAHHAAIAVVAPSWAYAGATDIGRITVHVFAVLLQLLFLGALIMRTRALINALAVAHCESEKLTELAIQARLASEAALDAAKAAECRATDERSRREATERDAGERRRIDLQTVARNFENGILVVAASVAGAAQLLVRSAEALQAVAHDTNERANKVAIGAAQASTAAAGVLSHATELSEALDVIVDRACAQGQRNANLHITSIAGHNAVTDLSGRVTQIEQVTHLIDDLARTINLVALNASVEAARVGQYGAGFAVVAGEVKELAGRAGRATQQIEQLTGHIHEGATRAEDALSSVAEGLAIVSLAGSDLRQAADRQRTSAVEVAHGADELSQCASHVACEIEAVAGLADTTRVLSDQLEGSAAGLLANVESLERSTQDFVAQLLRPDVIRTTPSVQTGSDRRGPDDGAHDSKHGPGMVRTFLNPVDLRLLLHAGSSPHTI